MFGACKGKKKIKNLSKHLVPCCDSQFTLRYRMEQFTESAKGLQDLYSEKFRYLITIITDIEDQ
jgi:hypothetical protein